MRSCNRCGITLRGDVDTCPLCQGAASGKPDGQPPAFPRIPHRVPTSRVLLAWLAFCTTVAAAVCVTINVILPAGGWWCLFVLAGLGSLWVSFVLMLKKRRNLPKSILWQVAAVSILAWLWDRFTGSHGWALDYVVPILCTCAMVAMAVVAKIRRLHIQDYILYLGMDCILGIVSFALVVSGSVRVVVPSAICFGASVIFLAALLFFEGKALFTEIQRRLHL